MDTLTHAEIQVAHRKATIRTMLRHGDFETDWTTTSLAARIGLPEELLIKYIDPATRTPRWVDSLVGRYLSVPIRHWQATGA